MKPALWIGMLAAVLGHPTASDVEDTKVQARRLEVMKQAAAEYKFVLIDSAGTKHGDATLHPGPLLRWNNQVVEEVDAGLFLWKSGSRPVAAAQFFLQGEIWYHEFQSLSPAKQQFEATLKSAPEWSWRPNKPGIEFHRADMESPAATAVLRLSQMREIARRFTAACDPSRSGNWTDPHELRLLSTPVYRYSDEPAGIIDGAIFAFAQGTNPEVLIQFEAVLSSTGTAEWRYAFAPMTSFQVKVRQGESLVWELPVAPVPTLDPHSPYQFRKAEPASARPASQ
jgi:hypothetical protein